MKDWYNKANLIITVKGKDVQIMNQEREKLGSRLGFLLLSAGCAIGCGNVWKFPWMTCVMFRMKSRTRLKSFRSPM